MAAVIVTMVFSTLALILSIGCFIKIAAVELSKTEFIQMSADEMFETDISKINESIEEDGLNESIDNTFEPEKQETVNRVII